MGWVASLRARQVDFAVHHRAWTPLRCAGLRDHPQEKEGHVGRYAPALDDASDILGHVERPVRASRRVG
jgi:hypothetical protein